MVSPDVWQLQKEVRASQVPSRSDLVSLVIFLPVDVRFSVKSCLLCNLVIYTPPPPASESPSSTDRGPILSLTCAH